MSDERLERLLGTTGRDPGCDGAFDVLDQYVEAVRRGVDVHVRYAEFVTHIRNCTACREDTDGMLAALEDLGEPPANG